MEMVSEALDEVERLAQLMAQHGATRIEISDDGRRIALTRVSGAGAPPMHEESLPPLFVSGYAEPAHVAETAQESLWQPPALVEVRSEFVGYCTLAPLEIGASVERGQPLATVEVLGIPNEVVAPLPAVLDSWAVESGQPVQYGQPIAYLRPLSEE
jgi:acetyl-CoA carboxylase biotin carboxyl carrier protein